MEKKHTPAPWKPDVRESSIKVLSPLNGTVVASVYKTGLHYEADANLIAEAPNLLKAVELMWGKVKLTELTDEEVAFIHQVVKSATK